MKKVNLGCGTKLLDGWINVDIIDYPNVLKHDLRKPLPFNDNSIDFFFSEHCIEHFSQKDGFSLIKEIYRCLVPNGVVRITVPNLEFIVECYNNNKLDAWESVNYIPKTKCNLMNDAFCKWGHMWQYDFEYLKLILKSAGFINIYKQLHKISDYKELNNIETRPFTGELILEAMK